MNKNEFEVMKKTLSTGEFDGLSIRVVNAPRFFVKLGDREFWLDGKDGQSNRKDFNPSYILERLRASLTTKDLGESFAYIGADRVTADSERRNLSLNLSHYGVNTYTGVLAVPNLANHIEKAELSNESPESVVGLETSKPNRIIFNLVGSFPCANKDGFDRVKHGALATVYLNSNTGEYLAEKTDACRAKYAPLAHLKPSEITNTDLVKALGSAPVELIYQV